MRPATRNAVIVNAPDDVAVQERHEQGSSAPADLGRGIDAFAVSFWPMAHRAWIVDSVGAPTFDRLSTGLAGSELQSLLLEVMQARALARSAKELVAQHGRDPFCVPAPVDLRTMLAIDSHLLAAAERFEAIELSPVAPMGTCSVVGLTHQHRVLSALRGTEVVSDPTNVLALECALRLRAHPRADVHLATSQRVIRAQPAPKLPGYGQHFRIFVLGSAGIEREDHAFTIETVALHVRTILAGLTRLEREGYALGQRRVEILASPEKQRLGERLAGLLDADHQPLEHPYYSGGLRYRIWVSAPDGTELPLADGGTFDWLSQLTSNRRAVFVGSGLGSQVIALRFGPKPLP